MNIYEEKLKKDIPILIERLSKIQNKGPFRDKETEILENFLDERGIDASAELIRKLNRVIEKQLPHIGFLYARAKAQREEQLGREKIYPDGVGLPKEKYKEEGDIEL